MISSNNVIFALQAAIAPVTMISAVGFLSLVTSNRFARVVDRMRALLSALPAVQGKAEEDLFIRETKTLYRRSRNLCLAAFMGGACIFFTSLTIFMLFSNGIFDLKVASSIAQVTFLISLVLLLCFTLLFTYDFAIAQRAIRFELDQHLKKNIQAKTYLSIPEMHG